MQRKVGYDHKKIEARWRERWLTEWTYVPDIGKDRRGFYKQSLQNGSKEPFYNLWMFPYPSAEGLHAGHAFSSTGSDIYGRFARMQGKQVLQPIGYDSFGIHSENFALSIGEHPKDMLARTTKNYERQLKSLGHGYDWTRTVTTSEPDYYTWTQWLFSQMFKAGLAYRAKSSVNWCPSCKTVLADEQVIAGVCERCRHKVEQKQLEQWFFRITDYADRLLANLEKIDWPEKIKIAQRNWIGRSEGALLEFKIHNSKVKIKSFTTRPDTLYGATFFVLAPEHPQLFDVTMSKHKSRVQKYVDKAREKRKQDRIAEGQKKSGLATGGFVINPVTREKIPVFVADYVVMDYGTGAIMGVPAHDQRDFEFAKKYKLPVVRVVVGPDGDKSPITKIEQVQEEEGMMLNSGFLNGMDIARAIKVMKDHIEKKRWGKREITYHLRDWLISRQRYWGPPIPMIFCPKCGKEGKSYFTKAKAKLLHKDQSGWNHAGWYPEEKLPVTLPYYKDYQPKGTGRGPLADHPEFYETKCPACGGKARRETDVSDTFLDSSWYFLRYPSVGSAASSASDSHADRFVGSDGRSALPRSKLASRAAAATQSLPWDPEITKRWLPVDLYFGGAEHAVLHLMYSRFVWMVLSDLGHLPPGRGWEEPFPKFFAHGFLIKDGAKMSKSRGNVVSPDEYIDKFGADTFRLYLMFLGPMDKTSDFRDTGVEGMRRFMKRVWNLFNEESDFVLVKKKDSEEVLVKMHQTIKKVTKDIEKFHYNTAIASLMEFVNLLREKVNQSRGSLDFPRDFVARKSRPATLQSDRSRSSALRHSAVSRAAAGGRISREWDEDLRVLAKLLAPFAPHLMEEVWVNSLGEKFSIHTSAWPKYKPELAKEEVVTIIVQVDGKLRGQLSLEVQEAKSKSKVMDMAKRQEKIAKWFKEKKVKRIVFVPGKLINFVTG